MFTKFGAAFRSIGMYGAFVLWVARTGLTRGMDFPKNPVAYLFFAFIGSATLSGALSSDLGESVRVFKKDVFNPLLWFLVIATHFGPPERQKRLLTALGTSGIIVILFGYWNYFRGETYGGALAAFRDPNSYAMNVAILLPFVFALAFVAMGRQGKVLWGTVAMLGVIASVLTLSRGGWLGLAAILAIWGTYVYQSRSRKQLIVVSACMVLLLVPVTLTNSDVIRKAKSVQSIGYRVGIWQIMTEAISEKPIVGWGIGRRIFVKVFSERWKARYGDEAPKWANEHSVYLQVPFHQGIIGLGPYLLLIPATFKEVQRHRHDADGRAYPMALAGLSALAGVYWIHGLVDSMRWVPFGLLLGWICALSNEGKRKIEIGK